MKRSILAFGICALGLCSALYAGAETQRAKSFGPWFVIADNAKGSAPKYAWVRLGQSQNEDSAGIGDNVGAEWAADSQEIKVSIEIQNCEGEEQAFDRSSSLPVTQWSSKGAKSAATQMRALMAGWVKEATAQCTARKPATMFKMAKLDLAMQDFLVKGRKLAAAAKGGK